MEVLREPKANIPGGGNVDISFVNDVGYFNGEGSYIKL